MAKVNLTMKTKQVVVDKTVVDKIILELTPYEAFALTNLTGSVIGQGSIRNATANVYNTLIKVFNFDRWVKVHDKVFEGENIAVEHNPTEDEVLSLYE